MNRPCTPPPRGILAPPSLGELQTLGKNRERDKRQAAHFAEFIAMCEAHEDQDLPNGVFPTS